MELDFYKTQPGVYVSYDFNNQPDNVLVIKKSYEETKSMPGEDDFIIIDIYEPYIIDLFKGEERAGKWYRKDIKYTIDSWLATGISDWDAKEINENKLEGYVIKALFCNWKF